MPTLQNVLSKKQISQDVKSKIPATIQMIQNALSEKPGLLFKMYYLKNHSCIPHNNVLTNTPVLLVKMYCHQ